MGRSRGWGRSAPSSRLGGCSVPRALPQACEYNVCCAVLPAAEPLYAKRAEVVSGAVEVPDNETGAPCCAVLCCAALCGAAHWEPGLRIVLRGLALLVQPPAAVRSSGSMRAADKAACEQPTALWQQS